LELPFDQRVGGGIVMYEAMFQSLFYWNCRLISSRSSCVAYGIAVSILILLELPFDPADQYGSQENKCSFNPYFIGIAV